jgi:pSer/pThr/pTyr-binding forkhead associated (FHA) protein
MRLVVKHQGSVVQEYPVAKGPVYIGRHNQNQILLASQFVSRQHAVLYTTADGRTLLEDLHSARGTFLNGRAVDKTEVKSGDVIRIADYTIEVELNDSTETHGVPLEDTLIAAPRQTQVIGRKFGVDHGPDLVMPAHRAMDFAKATSAICQANGPDETAGVLVDVLLEQFQAQAVWCGLREGQEGPWTSQAGSTRDGLAMTPHDLEVRTQMDRAVQMGQFLLLPHGPSEKSVGSTLIVPIMGARRPLGCIVVEKGPGQEDYHVRDLDYLMLLAMHTGAILENF